MEFNECDPFDLALALYHWLQHNWDGQTDQLYEDFCRLTAPGMFKPGPCSEYFENIDDNARAIYDELIRKNYENALSLVINYKSED